MGVVAAAGALLGAGAGAAIGATSSVVIFGLTGGSLWLAGAMIGASLGSLFDRPKMPDTTPNYTLGELSNTKSQVVAIPLVYGRVRMGGNVIYQAFKDSKRQSMDMLIALGLGPIEAIEDIKANEHSLDDHWAGMKVKYQVPVFTWVEEREHEEHGTIAAYWAVWSYKDVDKSAWATWKAPENIPQYVVSRYPKKVVDANSRKEVKDPLPGCSVSRHLGTVTQAADWRGKGEKYPNIAYIGATIKAGERMSGNPVISSIVKGRHIWTPGGVKYSNNPVWIVYDLLCGTYQNPVTNRKEPVGLGLPVELIDMESFKSAATYCDQRVSGQPRFTCDIALDQQKELADHIQDVLSVCRGFLICRDKVSLHIDRPVSSPYKAIDSSGIIEGSFSWWQLPDEDRINRAVIEWIDPKNHWERTVTVFEVSSDIAARGIVEKRWSLLGITNAPQAARMGAYLLDTALGVDNFCSFKVSLKDSDVEVGDVIALTHDLAGWNGKWMRVSAVTEEGDDTIQIFCAEYVAEIYNDRAADIPVHIDTSLSNPLVLDDVTNLRLEEWGYKTPEGNHVANLNVTWSTTELTSTELWFRENDEPWRFGQLLPPGAEKWCVEGLKVGVTFSVRAVSRTTLGLRSAGEEASVKIVGRDALPPAPTGLSLEKVSSDRSLVKVSWQAIHVIDLKGYRLMLNGVEAVRLTGETSAVLQAKRSGTQVVALHTVDNAVQLSQPVTASLSLTLEPATPTEMQAKQEELDRTWISLSWKGVAGVDIAGYEIRTGESWDSGIYVGFTADRQFRHQLQQSGDYIWHVKARTTAGHDSVRAAHVKLKVTLEPEDVQGLEARQSTADKGLVHLSWQAVSGADISHYEIRRGADWEQATVIARRVDALFFDDRVTVEDQYRYWIVAWTIGGHRSSHPQSVDWIGSLVPTAPSNLKARQDPWDRMKLLVNWDASPDLDVVSYELRDGLSWASALPLGVTADMRLTVTLDSSHEFGLLLRCVNRAGYWSPVVSLPYAALVEPGNVTGFRSVQDGDKVDLYWNKSPEPDVTGYEIREGSTWEGGRVVADGVTGASTSIPVSFERLYAYHIKALNRGGRWSRSAARAQLVVSELPPKNVLKLYDEMTLKSGTHDRTAWISNPLTWQTVGGQWNEHADKRFMDFGSDQVLAVEGRTGRGVFTTVEHDLGRLVSANLSVDFVATGDGSATLEYRTKRDDEWTGWQPFTAHQERLRWIQFRVVITEKAFVTVCKAQVDMPDVVKAGRMNVSDAGATVSYGFDYVVPPVVVATADGGDRRAVLDGAPEVTQCRVKVLDTTGVAASGTVNWTAYGY